MKQHKYLPAEIELLTGITKADLENAPSFYAIKKELKEILKDASFDLDTYKSW